jgi:thiosulfate/3-mercaptopyruvate sulfurtransferase
MSFSTLISAEQLREAMRSGAPLVVLDTSFELADTSAGERSYTQAHLPGAHYLHLDRDLSGPKTGRNGRHPLPKREAFAAIVGRLGIGPDTQVVVYDRQGAMFAARAWWMLRWLGHDAVAVLDGGLGAWQQAGGGVDSGPVAAPGLAPYPLRTPLVRIVEADELAASLGTSTLIDARAPERFRGEVEPLDAQAGHIPGALNRFFKDNLDSSGRFKSADELRAAFSPLAGSDPSRVVHNCGSGATACHNILAMRLAGFGETSLYPGSWSEWSADPTRPVARG